MQKLNYVAASVLVIASESFLSLMLLAPMAQAMRRPDANAPYIIHSVAYPKNATYKDTTYHFGLQVAGMTISKLTVDIPDGIRMPTDVQVSDQAKRKIPAKVSSSEGKVTIAFTQPIPVNTSLEIDLNGVDASFYIPTTKLFYVTGTEPGLNRDIPFGTARFRTSR